MYGCSCNHYSLKTSPFFLPPHHSSLPILDFICIFNNYVATQPYPKLWASIFVRRIDMQQSMTQLAEILGFGISDTAIEKWEKNQNRPTDEH